MTDLNQYKFELVLCDLNGRILTTLTAAIPFPLATHIANVLLKSDALADDRMVALVQKID